MLFHDINIAWKNMFKSSTGPLGSWVLFWTDNFVNNCLMAFDVCYTIHIGIFIYGIAHSPSQAIVQVEIFWFLENRLGTAFCDLPVWGE